MSDDEIDCKRRRFLTTAASVVGGTGVVLAATPFVASLQPSAKTLAEGAPIEVDIGHLKPGQLMRAMWRRRPVWVLRRSEEALAALSGHQEELIDPTSEEPQQPAYAANNHRSINPEYLVLIGTCTHLGCSPAYVPAGESSELSSQLGTNWRGGFFCPCHGSRFDLAGRVEKGFPAPSNLVVPPHRYLSATRLVIGADEKGVA
ncbi:MAG: ubiquinol-cytochrome c reductase iron-sulfur subunit [Pseudomonadota bacterium]|nr:ubiquinol-cytochrome c reductase iron-sulfur subunit [Pseudomonadota bacterium]